jgi:predicted nucleic acid-binding protein
LISWYRKMRCLHENTLAEHCRMLRIYLDMCCFNRPYDDQSQSRIRLETEAKLLIQQKVKQGECYMLWSSTLDVECAKNPFEEHQMAIARWRSLAVELVYATPEVVAKAHEFARFGVSNYDALHIASAIAGEADYFVTTDDRLLRKMRGNDEMRVMLPNIALAELEGWYED